MFFSNVLYVYFQLLFGKPSTYIFFVLVQPQFSVLWWENSGQQTYTYDDKGYVCIIFMVQR